MLHNEVVNPAKRAVLLLDLIDPIQRVVVPPGDVRRIQPFPENRQIRLFHFSKLNHFVFQPFFFFRATVQS
jgi:hypothetical protein